jgi:hypothetical protein
MASPEAQSDHGESVVRRFVLTAAAIGVVVPILIFAISEARLITDTWWFNSIPFVWPTYLMMLPFSGSLDGITVGVLLLSAAANAAIYGAIGAVLFLVIGKSKRTGASHTSQRNG